MTAAEKSFANIGEYFDSFPPGTEARFWTNQGEWVIRSSRTNSSQLDRNMEVDWVPYDEDRGAVLRSLMGAATGAGEQARFILSGGHKVELELEPGDACQEVAFRMDEFYRVVLPIVAPGPPRVS
jgi:hypothetical protein